MNSAVSKVAPLGAIILVVCVILIIIVRNIRVVPQANAYVIERLGTFKETWGTGLHVKMPFLDNIVKKLSLKEQVADFAPQAVITKDNVTMQIDTVVFYQVVDPKLYTYGIENPILAIENLSATTLRNVIGDLELDETLTSRDLINAKMRETLDIATDPWGIKVNRVELKNIIPPREIQNAMERQMKAEREKRENILRAEGKKQAQITVAEGEKQAAILRAEAKKLQAIREAEGEAEAILSIQEATARGLRMIKDVAADESLIAIKGLETLAKVADGRATKLIIPSNLQNLASVVTAAQEIWTTPAASEAADKSEQAADSSLSNSSAEQSAAGYRPRPQADPNGPRI
ncbi:MAG: SPFH domain-containing protein [Eubacteriales bacterium]|nr:SPFH domain-containing protein [Eubacteriales bacterium]